MATFCLAFPGNGVAGLDGGLGRADSWQNMKFPLDTIKHETTAKGPRTASGEFKSVLPFRTCRIDASSSLPDSFSHRIP